MKATLSCGFPAIGTERSCIACLGHTLGPNMGATPRTYQEPAASPARLGTTHCNVIGSGAPGASNLDPPPPCAAAAAATSAARRRRRVKGSTVPCRSSAARPRGGSRSLRWEWPGRRCTRAATGTWSAPSPRTRPFEPDNPERRACPGQTGRLGSGQTKHRTALPLPGTPTELTVRDT